MRFLFVDEITDVKPDEISGLIHFSEHAPLTVPYFHPGSGRDRQVAPGLISEAIGQLSSWKVMSETDFQSRPIFLFSEHLDVFAPVYPGDTVAFTTFIHDVSEQDITISGEAKVDGRLVQRLNRSTNYFIPISELEDPIEVQQRFHAINRKGGAPMNDASPSIELGNFILDMEKTGNGTGKVRCMVSPEAGFYQDHFSRRPITPIVVLNEIIGIAARKLQDENCLLNVKSVSQLKIKSFVSPGDEFFVVIKSIERQDSSVNALIDLIKAGKPILRGKYSFDVFTNHGT